MLFVHFSDFFLRDLHDFLSFLLGNLFFALGLCFLKKFEGFLFGLIDDIFDFFLLHLLDYFEVVF